jgi:DNA modification methylase
MAQTIETWPVSKLVPYGRNPRKNDGAVDRMVASIQQFGFKIPVLARSDGEVVDGHLRLKAALKMGLSEIPVMRCDEWTPAQVKAFRLMVNRSVSWADWDEELLALEIGELQDLDFDLKLTGFDSREIDGFLSSLQNEPLADEDEVPITPAQPVSRSGDLWVLGPHRLLCGDATDPDMIDSLMQSEKAGMVFTDPPYNVNYDGPGSVGESWAHDGKGSRVKKQVRSMLNDHMSDEDFLKFCRGLFDGMRRCVQDDAAVYVCCSDKAMPQFRQAFEQAGFHWSCNIVWAKSQFCLSRADYHPQHEPILYGWVAGKGHYWCGRRDLGTVWNLAKPRVNELHPTQKPVELIERAIENSSEANQIVLDICGGSGSTIIACEKLQRRARLVELDPKFADVTVERWQAFTGAAAMLDGSSFDQVKAHRLKAAA